MKLYFYNKEKKHTQSDTDRLIKESLSAYLGKEVSSEVKRTETGKPYLNDLPLHVGVTHTEDIVLIAIGEKSFGIDCESMSRTVNNFYRIAEKYYSSNEKAYVFEKNSDEEVINARFLEIWVKKEAYVKYTGEGLSAISQCDVTLLCGFKRIDNQHNLLIYIYEDDKHE